MDEAPGNTAASEACPNCSTQLRNSASFCSGCGTPVGKRFCVQCGVELSASDRFCLACGTSTASTGNVSQTQYAPSHQTSGIGVPPRAIEPSDFAPPVAAVALLGAGVIGGVFSGFLHLWSYWGMGIVFKAAFSILPLAIWLLPLGILMFTKSSVFNADRRRGFSLGVALILGTQGLIWVLNLLFRATNFFWSEFELLVRFISGGAMIVGAALLVVATARDMRPINAMWNIGKVTYLLIPGVLLATTVLWIGSRSSKSISRWGFLDVLWDYVGRETQSSIVQAVLIAVFAVATSLASKFIRQGAVASIALIGVTDVVQFIPFLVSGDGFWLFPPYKGILLLGLCAVLCFSPESIGRPTAPQSAPPPNGQ